VPVKARRSWPSHRRLPSSAAAARSGSGGTSAVKPGSRDHLLDLPSRPARRPRPAGCRSGNAPLPDLAHLSPPRPPRPPADPEHQPGLTVEGGLPHLLATALCSARTRLTSTNHPRGTKGGTARRGRSRCAPGRPGYHRADTLASQTDTTPESGQQHGSSTISKRTSSPLND
jgi:hypothetical protein